MDDLRLEWIKKITCKHLDILEQEAFDDLFDRDANCAKVLYSFLTGSKERRCIYFYDSIKEEEIEVEIPSPEPSTENEVNNEDNEHAQLGSVSITIEEAKTEESSEVRTDDDDDDEAKQAEDENSEVEDEEDKEEISKKEVMKQIVRKTVLNVTFNIVQYIPEQRYVYFLLRKFDPIPFLETWEETEQVMPDYFEIGLLNSHPLMIMLDTLSLVFLPLFNPENSCLTSVENQEELIEDEIELARKESVKAISNFVTHSQLITEQLEKPSPFELPIIPQENDPEQLSQDPFFAEEAQDSIMKWNSTLATLLPVILNKKPSINNPFSEILFWKELRSELEVLSDHLSNQSLQCVLKTLEIMECSELHQFYEYCSSIKQMLFLTNDNLNYLQNLEPYLKDLQLRSPLPLAIRTIDPLLNIYKLLWTLSEYYGRAENMGRLIEGTGVVVEAKMTFGANVKVLFDNKCSKIQEITEHCCRLAEQWKHSYLTQKSIIESFEGLQHWYYSKKTLFEKTDFMIFICRDLAEISEKIEQLLHILKPELKMLSRNIAHFDELETKIQNLSLRIKQVDFDIFLPKNRVLWTNLMQWFSRQCRNIENDAKVLISNVLKEETNFENSMMLIRLFHQTVIPQSISDLINEKYSEVLNRYVREVQDVEAEFLAQKDHPPKFKGFPQFTSSIIWERHLLAKIKAPILVFRENENFIKTEKGQKVQDLYLHMARTLKNYENEKFHTWQETVNTNISMCLQSSLLKLEKVNFYYYSSGDGLQKFKGTKLLEMTYSVNFPLEFGEMLMDAGYLTHMGFKMSHQINNFISQEEVYVGYVKELNTAVHKLHSIIGTLNYAEAKLLEGKLEKLSKTVNLGLRDLHWASLTIPQFLVKVKQATDYFGSLVQQVKMIGEDIEIKIDSLKSAKLFYFKKLTEDDVSLCQVYFEEAEKQMRDKMEDYVTIYHSVLPLLYKLESLTCHSSTGKAEVMSEYYRQCEIKVLAALIEMVTGNLELLLWSLETQIYPFFDAVFHSNSKLVLASTERALQTFMSFLIDCVKSTALFGRWMDGTCIETSHQYIENKDNDTFKYTFYSDVCIHPEIRKLIQCINTNVQKYIQSIKTS